MSTASTETGAGVVLPPAVVAPLKRDATTMELAAVIANSRDFPDVRTPEKAAVRILAGKEMGVGPIASAIGIRVQNGRVSMDATLMAGCIKRSGRYDFGIHQHDNEACDLVFTENGQTLGHSTFTMADARAAGLADKETWKSYPRNMLFARALSNGARWYCAGIFGGSICTHEELGYSVDEEGRAIETASGHGGRELCTRDQRQEDEARKPSTQAQRDAILGLAAWLIPDEDARYDALVAAKKRKGIESLRQLSQLQAAAWIEELQVKVKQQREEVQKT